VTEFPTSDRQDAVPREALPRAGRHLVAASVPAAFVLVFATGAAAWLPVLMVALIVGRLWAEVFARIQHRPVDPVWLPAAWLFSLLLPAGSPLALAALGLSFGLVFGCYAFGGSGRYLVNPALLGLVFLGIAYPKLLGSAVWLPDAAIGTPAVALTLASFVGAGYLIYVRVAAAPIVAGGLIALVAAAAPNGLMAWSPHLLLGNFALVLAFVSTDPTTRPRTVAGRWVYGALFGALTVVLRSSNPDHPEGTFAALLLPSLCVPLIDRLAGALHRLSRRAKNV
jgi:Na+-transporting NADH:ubiquinone oxidoreductase subunit B